MSLAYEIVETRARELCLAYKNVVMVAAGYRTKRAEKSKTGRTSIVETPCVTLVVRHKWKGKGPAAQRQQALPSHLLTYAGLAGDRLLYAVPTDVVVEEGFFRARLQAPSGIAADQEGGNATCAAEIQSGSKRELVMLSCQHVLTPNRSPSVPYPVEGTEVVLLNNRSISLGFSSPNGGQIRSDGSPSFDVQLTGPADRAALRAALDGMSLAPGREHIHDKHSMDVIANSTQFIILVSPSNKPTGREELPVAFMRYVPNVQGIPYPFTTANGGWQWLPVNHRLLIMFRIISGPRTELGDSGSPIVMRAPGGGHTLVGMHIAGGIEGGYPYSYAIPAWLLFNRAQYSHLPPGATLIPVNP